MATFNEKYIAIIGLIIISISTCLALNTLADNFSALTISNVLEYEANRNLTSSEINEGCERIKLPANLIWSGFTRCRGNRTESSKIAGGKYAEEGEFPYIVSLKDGLGHFCAGVIIHPRWILTAGHCIKFQGRFVIVVNTDNTRYPKPPIVLDWEQAFVHQKPGKFIPDDIALIKLKRKINVSGIYAVKIDESQKLNEGDELFAAGWGETDTNRYAHQLLKTKVLYRNITVCSRVFRGMNRRGHLCAGGPIGDVCRGDSGGPLIIKGDKPAEDIVVGLTSFGRPGLCSRNKWPSVFTDVNHYAKWIRAVLEHFGDKIITVQKNVTSKS